MTAAGEVDPTQVREQPVWRQVRERQIAPPSAKGQPEASQPCFGVTVFTGGGPAPRIPATVDALSRQSAVVAVGTVAELIPGFYNGVPATIVRVSVSDRLKYTGDSVLFMYPVARFTAAGRTFCRTNLLYGDTPSLGDELLLFGNLTIDKDDKVFLPLPYEVLIERGGHIAIPAALANDPDINSTTTLSDLARRLRDRLSREVLK